MSPPKAKLHRNTGKLKSIPKTSSGSIPASQVSTSDVTEICTRGPDEQFELELYWCIQQLENSLNIPHTQENKKKMVDTTKLINLLKSPNQPLVKKRQIMRTNFGNYRTKMAEEEKSMALNPESVKFDVTKNKPKYHFVKKAASLNSTNDFRLNFSNILITDEQSESDEKLKTEPDCISTLKIVTTSGNSFKFNFSMENQ
ncbi:UPF0488 protein CG14286 [Topomyia yanbarensis]|uniref:UPF0488 protein CG14286 n=1 Tax=Topomyia yanbarensis TaxID=2498891 RepID=UPI00273B2CE1|nr:UPF0488 protein CG14286 [Topomyia yanbarensis]